MESQEIITKKTPQEQIAELDKKIEEGKKLLQGFHDKKDDIKRANAPYRDEIEMDKIERAINASADRVERLKEKRRKLQESLEGEQSK